MLPDVLLAIAKDFFQRANSCGPPASCLQRLHLTSYSYTAARGLQVKTPLPPAMSPPPSPTGRSPGTLAELWANVLKASYISRACPEREPHDSNNCQEPQVRSLAMLS